MRSFEFLRILLLLVAEKRTLFKCVLSRATKVLSFGKEKGSDLYVSEEILSFFRKNSSILTLGE